MTPNNDDALVEALERLIKTISDSEAGEVDRRLALADARAALTAHRNYKGE